MKSTVVQHIIKSLGQRCLNNRVVNRGFCVSTEFSAEDTKAVALNLDALADSKYGERFSFLRAYFNRPQMLDLVLNCSNALTDSESNLEQKLDYILKVACHNPETVVKSRSLAFSVKHIMMRHEFLIRAGLFKTVPFHKIHKQLFFTKPNYPRDKYFPPSDIICTSDKDFLKKCTKNLLTLNELVVFEEIFDEELEKKDIKIDEEEQSNPSASALYFSAKDSTEFYF